MHEQILEIERVAITAADHKQVKCYDITIKVQGKEEAVPHNIRQLVQQKMCEIGKILLSQDILDDKSSFSGAIEGAVNKELEVSGVFCRDIHITSAGY